MDKRLKKTLITLGIIFISIISFFAARFLMIKENKIVNKAGDTIDLGITQTTDTKPSKYLELSGKVICLKDGSEKNGECTVGLRADSTDYAVLGFKKEDSSKIREGVKIKLSGRLQTDKMAGYPKIYVDNYEIQ